MARPSQTELAVLGALSTGPMTGYEVRAAISESLGHFWHESFGQIYPTLAALEEAGAITPADSGRRTRTVYEITPAGVERLEELLAEPHRRAPARNGLLLRLFFGTHLPQGTPEALLEEAEEQAAGALEQYAAVRDEVADDEGTEQAFRTMTLSFGEHMARAQLAWARECRAALPRRARSSSGGGRARG
ncbi:PadR family transcriptional regulator [Oryzobacter telluris]|uniref:PadR family transcriptional regulator n=1 Tax=Oryzobacter telluris TaxID=3149179 RepID=UPI00370DE03B